MTCGNQAEETNNLYCASLLAKESPEEPKAILNSALGSSFALPSISQFPLDVVERSQAIACYQRICCFISA
jgi:hypothetical protein